MTRTTQQPKPSSDEISRAYEEGWVGQKGYQKENGKWQERALVFIGDTHSTDGEIIPEIYIVDLPSQPEDYMVAGNYLSKEQNPVCLLHQKVYSKGA